MPADADRRDIAWAMTRARRSDPDVHPSAFDFLQNTLMAETEQPPTQELSHTAALRFAMKVQQFSGPVMAKGVEDTAFYRYNRFVALNEVGGAPERFGLAPALFHKANAARAQNWPHAMLATATHDTKRGEDNRARLAVLSEMPEEWRRQVETWTRILRARRGDVERTAAPDRDDDYMLYQMFVGSWPIDMLDAPSDEQREAYGARIHAALEKSLREAKRRSSWAAPDADYEQATQTFAKEALRSDTFLSNFLPFTRRVARLGIENSLIQTVGKLTAPGVPDIYQGCELWDLNLVDPDNRRPVDFAHREAAIADLAARLKAPDAASGVVHDADGRMAGRPSEAGDNRPAARASARGAGAFRERRLSAARHRGRSLGLGLWLCADFRRPEARCRDGALPRASRGGAQVERSGAIAGSALVRPVSRPGRRRRRSSP